MVWTDLVSSEPKTRVDHNSCMPALPVADLYSIPRIVIIHFIIHVLHYIVYKIALLYIYYLIYLSLIEYIILPPPTVGRKHQNLIVGRL